MSESSGTITARRRIEWTNRPARAQHWLRAGRGTRLEDVLDRAFNRHMGTSVVYLLGDRPGGSWPGFLQWAEQVPTGWTVGDHWLNHARPVLKYRHEGTGQVVEVHRAASWFGQGDYSATEAVGALGLLGRVARQVFDDGAAVLATPATTGRDWIVRTLPHRGVELLPDDAASLVRATSGQGRWELLTVDDDRDALPGLYGYDMRFGYAALCWGLGSGLRTWDNDPTFEPYARGRYRVTVTVPDGWAHIGLVGAWDADAQRWRYPSSPGERFETWADGAELHLASRHGWAFDVHERMLWNDGKPLDRWASVIVAMRDQLADLFGHPDYTRTEVKLAADAARMALVAGIGTLHSAGSPVTRRVPIVDGWADVPPEATDAEPDGDGHMVYTLPTPPRWRQMAHPEWSAAVWARCRARLLSHRSAGALHAPRSELVALRQDAIYLTNDPGWADDGRVGSLRRVLARNEPVATPRNETELLEVRS